MFEIIGEANIETLPYIIFVFVNEVFYKIIRVFLWLYNLLANWIGYAPIYFLERFLHPWTPDMYSSRSTQNKNKTSDRQTKSSTDIPQSVGVVLQS